MKNIINCSFLALAFYLCLLFKQNEIKAQSNLPHIWAVNSQDIIRILPADWWDYNLSIESPYVLYTNYYNNEGLRLFGNASGLPSHLMIRTGYLSLPWLQVGDLYYPASFNIKTCESEVIESWQLCSSLAYQNVLETVFGTLVLGKPRAVQTPCIEFKSAETNLTIISDRILINQPMVTTSTYAPLGEVGEVSLRAYHLDINQSQLFNMNLNIYQKTEYISFGEMSISVGTVRVKPSGKLALSSPDLDLSNVQFTWGDAQNLLEIAAGLFGSIQMFIQGVPIFPLITNQQNMTNSDNSLVITASSMSLSGTTKMAPAPNKIFDITAGHINLGPGTQIGVNGGGKIHIHPMDNTTLASYQQCFNNSNMAFANTNSNLMNDSVHIALNTDDIPTLSLPSLNQSSDTSTVYPNPFSNKLDIAMSKEWTGQRIMLTIRNIRGLIIVRKEISYLPNILDVVPGIVTSEQLPSGVYFITLQGVIGKKVCKATKL